MNAFRIAFVMIGVMFLSACVDTADIIASKKAAVVAIVVEKSNPENKDKVGVGVGTGWFLKENYIVTNHHVVEDSKKVLVAPEDGDLKYEAEVVFSDEFADIAVIKLKKWEDFAKEHEVVFLQFASRDTIHEAEDVYAIGHPWGLTWSISKGIISNHIRRRDISPNFYIQTDASIYQGNSGGPLLNRFGEVVGMNDMMISNTGGSYGLAIPAPVIQKVLKDLEKYNEVRWVSIGMQLNDPATVQDVDTNKPAAKAGIEKGDRIIAYQYNGRIVKIFNSDQLISEVGLSNINEPFYLYVKRNDVQIKIEITPSFYNKSSTFIELLKGGNK